MNNNDKPGTSGQSAQLNFLSRGGEMGQRMREHDWAATPFGPPSEWPQSLKTSVSICLNSSFPIVLWWGPELRVLYNDAYRPVLGSTKHPHALGRPGSEVWSDIWDVIGPLLEGVYRTGEAVWAEDMLLIFDRDLPREEVYFTFSYSAITNEDGSIGGLIVPCTETTQRVVGERRLRTLGELGAEAREAETVEQACLHAARILEHNTADVPFALVYLLDVQGKQAVLAARSNIDAAHPAAMSAIELARATEGQPWNLGGCNRPEVVNAQGDAFGVLPGDPWPEASTQAMVLPLLSSGEGRAVGYVVAGINPRRPLDEDYRSFFNLMAGHIGTAVANASAWEEERRRAEALAELDRAKSAFFSNVSHEFRTPLTLMLGPLIDALEDERLPQELRERLKLAERNALRMSKLVNSLLEFSRIEAGRLQASYEACDLARLTEEVASTFRSAMEHAGLRFDVQCQVLPVPAFVDRDMWERIVLNLLSNALKFTLQGRVAVRLHTDGTRAVLEVQDTGVGVPEHELPRLFERFHRVEGTQGRSQEGSGIGLALVQELVKLHGGSIAAHSVLGQGTTFTIELPLGRSHLPAKQVAAGAGHAVHTTARQAEAYVQEALRWLPGPSMPDTPQSTDSASVTQRYRSTWGARIVVADDNADMLQYVQALLQPYYRVELVADGEQALQAIRQERPALLLSDVMMPRLDGFALLAALRADQHLRTLPVVLLSARAGEEARVEGLDAGADDYLVKPFTARELLARVAAVLQIDQERRVGEEQLRLGLATARMFTWDVDLLTSRVHMSENASEILGLVPTDLNEGMAFLHPDDAQRHRAAIDEAVRSRGQLTDEVRVVRRDSHEVRWIEVRARVVCDATGEPQRLSGISFDITDRKCLEHDLRESDRRKDEFLAMLAHELRNPIAPIRNAGELLLRLVPPDDRLRRAVTIINRQVEQLTRMVDDLLDVSRITRGRIELEREPVTLSAVVAAALEAVEAAVREKGHRVSVVSGLESLTVIGDAARLQQCLVNLLTNAVKYTDGGGEIRVELKRDGAAAVVVVADNGVGIPQELLPVVFDLFVQNTRTLDRSQGGLGIGLSVVKRLIEMHGGTMSVHSAGVGQGAMFEFRLPLVEQTANPGRPLPVDNGPRRRILVVDDNRDAAESLAMMLKFEGHEVQAVFSAEEALARALQFRPEVVFLDIGLPGLDGYQVVQQLRAHVELRAMRIVALTGYGQTEDRKRSQEAGFDEHLVKPASLQMLMEALAGS